MLQHVALLSSVHEFKSDALFRAVQRGDTDTSVCFLRPDQHHPHNQSDVPAAEYAYLRLQQLGVPLIIVSRHAVYQASTPQMIRRHAPLCCAPSHDGLNRRPRSRPTSSTCLRRREDRSQFACATRSEPSPFLSRVRPPLRASLALISGTQAKRSIEHLWFRVQQADASMREGLPARCTEAWFAQTFCNGVIPPGDQSPWDFVKKFSMYDSVTLISAIPELRTKLFSAGQQYEYDCGTASHIVYGHSEKSHGVAKREVRGRRHIH